MKIIKIFLKLCDLNLKKLFIYRASFFISLILMSMWVAAYYFLIEVIFYHTQTLSGWNKGHVLIIMSFYYYVQNIADIFYKDDVEHFGETVRRGELDFKIVKPVSTRLLAFFYQVRFDHAASLIATTFLFAQGISNLEAPITISAFVLGFLMLAVSAVFYYSILVMIATLTFWIYKNDTFNALIFNVSQLSRYPRQIYTSIVSKVLTFVIPLALIASVPAEVAFQFENGVLPLFYIGITVVFYILSSVFWYYGLRRYSSAN